MPCVPHPAVRARLLLPLQGVPPVMTKRQRLAHWARWILHHKHTHAGLLVLIGGVLSVEGAHLADVLFLSLSVAQEV